MIADERIKFLNDKEIADGPYVVYWMQSAQRVSCNHALEYALRKANELQKPLLVYFGLTADYPEANQRHYRFMLEGLQEVRAALQKRGIRLLVLRESPPQGALRLSRLAALMVTDRGYLRLQKAWREQVAAEAPCRLVQVETDVIVPVEAASPKEEYAARTLRPKINRLIETFAMPLLEGECHHPSLCLPLPFEDCDITDINNLLHSLRLDASLPSFPDFIGGRGQALAHLEVFIQQKLAGYALYSSEPGLDYASNLSPYLHFGQISPLEVYHMLMDFPQDLPGRFLEELVVRRELSMNFVFYNPVYDSFDCLPSFAKATLIKHADDPRPVLYSKDALEQASTHDPYWNAAQRQMVWTGKMQGYMRMYWGKKILEWSPTPQAAFDTALWLNNKYSLDGRDPNGFAGVAWCFGKHDRPWKEREIFGTVRYMNAKGLERKFDMKLYLDRVNSLSGPT